MNEEQQKQVEEVIELLKDMRTLLRRMSARLDDMQN